MKISYISPKKNVKNFSSRIIKPVLIFNTDKFKEKDLAYTEIKKKILNDSSNKIDNLDYGLNLNLNGGRVSPPKIKLTNGGHSKHINVHLINNGNGKKNYLKKIFFFIFISFNLLYLYYT
jgi:hypothetical protein